MLHGALSEPRFPTPRRALVATTAWTVSRREAFSFPFKPVGEDDDRRTSSQHCDSLGRGSAASADNVSSEQTDVVRCGLARECRVGVRMPVHVEPGVLERCVDERSHERVSFDMQHARGRAGSGVAAGSLLTGSGSRLGSAQRPRDSPHVWTLRVDRRAANPGYHPSLQLVQRPLPSWMVPPIAR